MKANKLFLIACTVLLTLGFTACDESDSYSAGPEVGSVEVTFGDEENIVLGIEDTEFKVTLKRADATNALTVPITVVTAPPTTKVPESVTFDAGEKEKEITITVGDGITIGQAYFLVLSIPDEYAANTYKKDPDTYTRYNATVLREDYQVWATATFSDEESWVDDYEINIEYSEMFDLYRLPDLYDDGTPWFFKWDGKSGDDQVFYIADANGEAIKQFFSGIVHPTYGNVMANILENTGYSESDKKFAFRVEYTVSLGSFGDANLTLSNIVKK